MTASSMPPPTVPPPRKPPAAVQGVLRGVLAGMVNALLWALVAAWLVSWQAALLGLLFQVLPAAGIGVFFWARGRRWAAFAVGIVSAVVFVAASALLVSSWTAPGGTGG